MFPQQKVELWSLQSKCAQNADKNNPVDHNKKRKNYIKDYMREYMKKRRADEKFRKIQNGNLLQSSCIISKTTRDKKNQAARKRKLNPEHVREIEGHSFRKQKAKNPEYIREINKQTVRKQKANNPEHIREINKQSVKKKKKLRTQST